MIAPDIHGLALPRLGGVVFTEHLANDYRAFDSLAIEPCAKQAQLSASVVSVETIAANRGAPVPSACPSTSIPA